MRKLLVLTLLLLAIPTYAQNIVGKHRQVFAAAGGGHTFSAPASANNRCYDTTVTGGNSVSCTLTTAPAASTLTVVYVFGAFGMSGLSVSDGTNSYTVTPNSPSATADASAGSVWMAYRYASGTSPATITATWSTGTCSYCSLEVDTFGVSGAGAVVLDMDLAGTGTTGTTINTPTATQSANGQLYTCFAASENSVTAVNAPWTISGHGIGSYAETMEYILSSTGSQACSFTQMTGHWDTIVASFK